VVWFASCRVNYHTSVHPCTHERHGNKAPLPASLAAPPLRRRRGVAEEERGSSGGAGAAAGGCAVRAGARAARRPTRGGRVVGVGAGAHRHRLRPAPRPRAPRAADRPARRAGDDARARRLLHRRARQGDGLRPRPPRPRVREGGAADQPRYVHKLLLFPPPHGVRPVFTHASIDHSQARSGGGRR
jgi:hypothetical protein